MKNELNRETIKFILNSKIYDFNFDNYSRKQLEFICLVCVSEYRHLKGFLDIMNNLSKKS